MVYKRLVALRYTSGKQCLGHACIKLFAHLTACLGDVLLHPLQVDAVILAFIDERVHLAVAHVIPCGDGLLRKQLALPTVAHAATDVSIASYAIQQPRQISLTSKVAGDQCAFEG